MKILALHNRYLIGGGEDQSHKAEIALLREQGHLVDELIDDNRRIAQLGVIKTSINTIWSHSCYRKVKSILHEKRYDLVLVQNYFPLFSPSVYYAAQSENTPVVQFLRNYRIFCLNGSVFRNNRPCTDCLQKQLPWTGIYHACYRGSRLGSSVVASMLVVHRLLKTWQRKVNVFVALTKFARDFYIRAGVPAEKIVIKPNFVYPDPGIGSGAGQYALFLGRLTPEKGIVPLLKAWESVSGGIRLKIVGEGPLEELVKTAVQINPTIDYLGRRQQMEVFQLMKEASVLIFPSLWYEGMPRTVIEAFSVGTPVIASEIGAASEMIIPEENGVFYQPEDAADLARKIVSFASDPTRQQVMRAGARDFYLTHYTMEQNIKVWQDIFSLIVSQQRE